MNRFSFPFLSKSSLFLAAIFGLNIFILNKLSGFHTIIAAVFILVLFGLPGMIYTSRLRSFNIFSIAAGLILGTAVSLLFVAVLGSVFNYFGSILFLFVPIALAGISFLFVRSHPPNEFMQFKITDKDIIGVSISICLTLSLIAAPLMSVGAFIDTRYQYSPFFCADFFKHMAVSQALNVGQMPPVNPFAASGSLNYYWLFYIIPASILNLLGPSIRADHVLLACNVLQVNLFVILLYAACRRFGAKAAGSTIAVVAGMLSLSLDGLASREIFKFIPLAIRSQLINVESLDITRAFGIPYNIAASSLFRLCLYIPQHLLAVSFFLSWLLLAADITNNNHSQKTTKLLILAVLPSVSLLYGAIALTAIFFIDSYFWLLKKRQFPIETIIGIVLSIVILFSMGILGLNETARLANNTNPMDTDPFLFIRLLLIIPQMAGSFGCIFLTGTAGMIVAIRNKNRIPLYGNAIAIMLATGIMAYAAAEAVLRPGSLRINTELKASFFMIPVLVLGTSLFITHMKKLHRQSRFIIASVSLGLALLGIPSIIHDVKWHSILLWNWQLPKARAVAVPESDMTALDWIRTNTSSRAVFAQKMQDSYLNDGQDAWVPIFSGRSVFIAGRGAKANPSAVGLNRRLFESVDADTAYNICGDAHIDFIYNSRAQNPGSYMRMESILGQSAQKFRKEFSTEGVSIWRVIKTDCQPVVRLSKGILRTEHCGL